MTVANSSPTSPDRGIPTSGASSETRAAGALHTAGQGIEEAARLPLDQRRTVLLRSKRVPHRDPPLIAHHPLPGQAAEMDDGWVCRGERAREGQVGLFGEFQTFPRAEAGVQQVEPAQVHAHWRAPRAEIEGQGFRRSQPRTVRHGIRHRLGRHLEEVLQGEGRGNLGGVRLGIPVLVLSVECFLPSQ